MKKLTATEAYELMNNHHKGSLDLDYTDIEELPDWLTVEGDLLLRHTHIKKLPNHLIIKGNLFIDYSYIEEIPHDIKVAGCIYAYASHLKKLPHNLSVSGDLCIEHTHVERLPCGLKVGGRLDIRSTNIQKIPKDILVGAGGLYMSHTPIKDLPDDLIIGWNLDVTYTKIKKLPKNLVVGGYINLDEDVELSTDLKSGWFPLRHGVLCGEDCSYLTHGDYVEGKYLFADGILTHVSHKKTIGEYTFYKGKIKGRNVVYDGKHYAHCKTFREGVEDLLVKSAKDRALDQYKRLSINTVMTVDELKTMYHTITGACRQGIEIFVSNIKDLKDKYTISEVIEMTRGHYGSEKFKKFFEY